MWRTDSAAIRLYPKKMQKRSMVNKLLVSFLGSCVIDYSPYWQWIHNAQFCGHKHGDNMGVWCSVHHNWIKRSRCRRHSRVPWTQYPEILPWLSGQELLHVASRGKHALPDQSDFLLRRVRQPYHCHASTFQMAIDQTIVANVTFENANTGTYREISYASQANVTFLCLLRDSSQSNPFVSAISLTDLPFYDNTFRDDLHFARQYYLTLNRACFGGNAGDVIRYVS